MKRGSTLFLKIVLLLIALIVLTFLLVFPWFEGRNKGADAFTVYLKDPFLAYVYLTSLPFFAALYQAFKLLGHIEKNKAFSPFSVQALRNIKYSASTIAVLITAIMPFFLRFAEQDDAPGVMLIVVAFIFISIVVATFAAVLQKLLQNAADIKSENDLTV